jgi:hypothetical protein
VSKESKDYSVSCSTKEVPFVLSYGGDAASEGSSRKHENFMAEPEESDDEQTPTLRIKMQAADMAQELTPLNISPTSHAF